MAGVPVLDASATARALPYGPLIEALEHGFRTGAAAPLRQHHATAGGPDLLIMPAWNGAFVGVKLVTVTPDNGARGLAAVHATYTLFDGSTGVPCLVLDGTELTRRRTAAASALAARYLARPDATRLTLLGAGALAPHLAEAHRTVRPLREVTIWNRTPPRAEALAAALTAVGFKAEATTDRRAAIETGDIVSAATMSERALIEGAWLRAGTHVDLVGAYTARHREADAATLTRARVVVDTREGALAEAGDVIQAIAEGGFDQAHIAGEIADLCRGAVRGRRDMREITAFKSVGTALEDLYAAALAMARAA